MYIVMLPKRPLMQYATKRLHKFKMCFILCLFSCSAFHRPIEGLHLHGATMDGVTVANLILTEHEEKMYIEGSVDGDILSHASKPIGLLVRIIAKDAVALEVIGCYNITETTAGPRLQTKRPEGWFSIALPVLPTSEDEVEVLPRFAATDCKN